MDEKKIKSLLASLGISSTINKICADSISIMNPANESLITTVQTTQPQHFDTLLENATQTFYRWRHLPAPKRGDIIRQIGGALRTYKEALSTLVSLETGKIKSEAEGEVQEMIDMADFSVGQSRMLYGKTMHSERPQHRMYEQWHPLGPIGVITAFNFPVAVWAWNAFTATICGNTVIWKPSPKTPLSAIAVQKICEQVLNQTDFAGVFSLLITQDNTLTTQLIQDKRLPLISFTGSVPVGKKVNQIVAERLGKSLLELSGNNAIIVDETADLSLAIPAIVFGAIGTAGQRCTTLRRLFVHISIIKELTGQLILAYQNITIGDPLDANVIMGPLIDASAVQNYENALLAIKQQGGEILYGGNVLSGKGFFVEPTLVTAQNHWEIVQKETFAPILYLIPYENLNDAILQQNNVPQGLSSAIFTENLKHAEYFLSVSGSDCGIANVNLSTSGAEIGGAFGGEKETGGGREAGSDAWKAYMRRQTTTINWGNEMSLAQDIKFNNSFPQSSISDKII